MLGAFRMHLFVREKAFYRMFFSMTLVLALQNLIAFSVNLADNIMLGAYSELSLSGAAVSNQVQFLLQMMMMGTGSGMVVIAAQYWGKRQLEPIKRVFAVALWVALIVSSILTAVAFFAPQALLGLLTNEAAVVAQGAVYLRILSVSYCFFAATTIMLGVMRSVETVKIGFWMSLSTLFVNVSLNYILIYGKFGMPEMGIRGAALATTISRILEFLIVLTYTGWIDKKLKLRLADVFGVQVGYVRDFFKTGMPTMLSSTSWGIAMGIQGAILGRLGATTIAANSIAAALFQVMIVLASGSASSSSVIIGKTVGSGDIERVRQYTKTLQMLFLGIGVLTGTGLLLSKNAIIGLYNVAPETETLANIFITVLSVTVVGTAYQMPGLTGIVSGGGDTKFVLFNDLIFMWGIVLPISALSAFVFGFPVPVTFICLKSDQIIKCAVAVVKINRFRWIKKLTRETAEEIA